MTCGHFSYSDQDRHGLDRYGLGIPAMEYQLAGYRVLPLVRGGKKPHRMLPEQGGVHHASGRPQDAARWWGADPAANIGVATGHVSRLAVVDLDVKGRYSGPESWQRFLRDHRLELSPAPVVSTPSGGQHGWLRVPSGAVPERPGILPGVDVKGDGGLVVVPPSMRLTTSLARPGEPGGDQVPVPYEWLAGSCMCRVADAPPWFLPWLASAPPAGVEASTLLPEDNGGALDYRDLSRTGITAGHRNVTLYKLACQRYRVHGTTGSGPSQVADEIRVVWEAGDRSGMSWREVLVCLESARRFIEKQQRNETMMRTQWMRRLS